MGKKKSTVPLIVARSYNPKPRSNAVKRGTAPSKRRIVIIIVIIKKTIIIIIIIISATPRLRSDA